jgi:Acyl-CoA dehydrogenases
MGWTTHEVTNQVPDLVDYNLFTTDTVLQEAVLREGLEANSAFLSAYGAELGQGDIIALAAELDRHAPQLHTHDRQGRRIDTVNFHFGWHHFLSLGCRAGLGAPGGVARAAAFLMHGQIEAGTLCPLTMTAAAARILSRDSQYAYLSTQLGSREYDARDLPVIDKHGMLVGMGLTEKQGGSDLRRITTQAVAIPEEAGWFKIVGHKWFFSAPTADAHLVLALLDGAPSCFYLPRRLLDGSLNGTRLQRLKDKLGNRSNASAEVEFHDARGTLVGEPGRGIAILTEMAGYTRVDCVLGSAALMRAAFVQAVHHARHRVAFGRPLIQQPMMRTVLFDLALEVEAALVLGMTLARSLDLQAEGSPLDQAFVRILTPAAKFWVCKRAIPVVAEAMEVLGGNGYVETHVLPRLYREAPVNSIWEGSGNVMCLDVLRGLQRHPDLAGVLLDWLTDQCRDDHRLLRTLDAVKAHSGRPAQEAEAVARHIAGSLVVLVQAVLLRNHAPAMISEAFMDLHLEGGGHGIVGMRASPIALDSVLERAWRAAC